MRKFAISMLVLLLFLIVFTFSSQAIIWRSTLFGDNAENVKFEDQAIDFRRIKMEDNAMTFNDTKWSVTTIDQVFITITYLDEDPVNVSEGDTVLAFTALAHNGVNVNFTISGFKPGETYSVYRDGSYFTSDIANDTGFVTFLNDEWFDYVQFYFQAGSYAASETIEDTTNYLTTVVIPLLIAIVMIGLIVGLIGTVGFSKETFIAILLIVILGIICIQVAIGL